MSEKDTSIAPLEGNPAVVEANAEATPATTPEETPLTAEQIAELKGFNERLLEENKKLKASTTPKVKDHKTKSEEKPSKSNNPLDETATMIELLKDYSLDELKEAQAFIGTPLGEDLKSVATNSDFKAVISNKRAKAQSDAMIETESLDLKPIETKKSIIRDIEAGRIDIKLPENAEYRKIYVQHKADNL